MRITSLQVRDIRFPTSRWLDGSDAMHRAPDYSCAYVTLGTDSGPQLQGCGLTFTNGHGTEVVVAGVRALERLVVGRSLEEITSRMSDFWRSLTSEDQGVVEVTPAPKANGLAAPPKAQEKVG